MSREDFESYDACPECGFDEFDSVAEFGVHFGSKHPDVPRPWWKPVEEARDRGSRCNWVTRRTKERDDHRCLNCGDEPAQSSSLHAHHVVPVRWFKHGAEAHIQKNVVTLCEGCHELIESAGFPPRQQFLFLLSGVQIESDMPKAESTPEKWVPATEETIHEIANLAQAKVTTDATPFWQK